MKKMLFVLIAVVAMNANLFASSYAEMASVDENYVENVFSDLNQLENYVVNHQGVTLNQLKLAGNTLVQNVQNSPVGALGVLAINGEPPLGIPSFLWGCVLGWVGILIVYLSTNGDKDEVQKSLIGCIVGSASAILFYFVFWGMLFASAASA